MTGWENKGNKENSCVSSYKQVSWMWPVPLSRLDLRRSTLKTVWTISCRKLRQHEANQFPTQKKWENNISFFIYIYMCIYLRIRTAHVPTWLTWKWHGLGTLICQPLSQLCKTHGKTRFWEHSVRQTTSTFEIPRLYQVLWKLASSSIKALNWQTDGNIIFTVSAWGTAMSFKGPHVPWSKLLGHRDGH